MIVSTSQRAVFLPTVAAPTAWAQPLSPSSHPAVSTEDLAPGPELHPLRFGGHRADSFTPGDGDVIHTTRLFFDRRQEPVTGTLEGREVTLVVTDTEGGRFVNAVDPRGETLVKCELPPGQDLEGVMIDERARRICVHLERTLQAYDLDTGRLQASFELGRREDNRCGVAMAPGGRIVTGLGTKLVELDSDLRPVWSTDLGFEARKVRLLGDGSILALHDGGYPGGLLHGSANGKALFKCSNIARGSVVSDDGNIWFLENRAGTWLGPRMVVAHCYDPASHKDRSFPVDSQAERIFPLPSGGSLTTGGLYRAHFELRSPSGARAREFSMDREEMLDSVYLSNDGRRAYVVADSYLPERGFHRRVYRLDLDAGSSTIPGWPVFNPFLPAWDASKGKSLVFETTSRGHLVVGELADGRTLFVHPDEIRLDGGAGGASRCLGTLDELLAAIGPHAQIVTRQLLCGTGEPMEADLRAFLKRAAAVRGQAPPEGGSPGMTAGSGCDHLEVDAKRGCLEVIQHHRDFQAPNEFGIADRAALEQMGTVRNGVELAMNRVLELPFEDGSRFHVNASASSIAVVGTDAEEPLGRLSLDDSCFTTVLPLSDGQHRYVIAGTTDGEVHFVSGQKKLNAEEMRASLGQPVSALALGDGNRVYALGEANGVLVLQPSLAPGSTLLAPRSLTHEASSSEQGPATIEKQEEAIVIGGITLPRRR